MMTENLKQQFLALDRITDSLEKVDHTYTLDVKGNAQLETGTLYNNLHFNYFHLEYSASDLHGNSLKSAIVDGKDFYSYELNPLKLDGQESGKDYIDIIKDDQRQLLLPAQLAAIEAGGDSDHSDYTSLSFLFHVEGKDVGGRDTVTTFSMTLSAANPDTSEQMNVAFSYPNPEGFNSMIDADLLSLPVIGA